MNEDNNVQQTAGQHPQAQPPSMVDSVSPNDFTASHPQPQAQQQAPQPQAQQQPQTQAHPITTDNPFVQSASNIQPVTPPANAIPPKTPQTPDEQPEENADASEPTPHKISNHPASPISNSMPVPQPISSSTPTPPPQINDEDSDQAPSSDAPSVDTDKLARMKKQALDHLEPLVKHLDGTPEETFKTTMMMIQGNDNHTLLEKALSAAKAITDDKVRAQALLDIVNEINYFSQPTKD